MLKLLMILSVMVSCDYKEQLVDVKIVDPVRHYYPILQGQELNIIIELENKSDSPFKITDILTSCGCVVVKKGTFDVIPAQSTGYLELTYNSNKNIGLVNHFIYIYGNLDKVNKLEANFDVHVVPDALYTPDYEELYRKEVDSKAGTKNAVEGNENEKGYYTSSDDSDEENNNTN
ncbi:DUF1573 domain-containing protein [Flavobacterium antarcticum]|uniref:DUF1573 domain-containing protein n=1 Tax=Flavobacterium antarcticum TaxID=271155 RepID=UPI001FE0D4E5|nr:DUF1573 domain-containing protein [Flavobacterium antarcticum]